MEERKELALQNRMKHRNHSRQCPKRYILTALVCSGTGLVFAFRVDLSVAIVAMTNHTFNRNTSEKSLGISECDDNRIGVFLPPDGEYSWDKITQGMILSSIFYFYLILQIPGGWLASRVNGKWTVYICILCASVLSMFVPFAASRGPWSLMVVRALQGLSLGVVYPGNIAISARWFPAGELSWLNSLIQVGAAVGVVLGMVITGFMSEYLGWQYAFYTTGSVGILWSFMWAYLVSESPATHKTITPEEKLYIEKSTKPSVKAVKTPWIQILTSVRVLALVILYFSFGWHLYMIMLALPQYVNDILSFGLLQNSFISALPYVIYCIVGMVSSRIIDMLVRRKYLQTTAARKISILLGFGGTALFFILMQFVDCDRILAATFLTLGFAFQGIVSHVILSNVMDLSRNHAALIFGLANTFGVTPGILAPFTVGAITQHEVSKQSWMQIFYISTGIGMFGLIFNSIFGTSERQIWDGAESNEEVLAARSNLSEEDDIVTS